MENLHSTKVPELVIGSSGHGKGSSPGFMASQEMLGKVDQEIVGVGAYFRHNFGEGRLHEIIVHYYFGL